MISHVASITRPAFNERPRAVAFIVVPRSIRHAVPAQPSSLDIERTEYEDVSDVVKPFRGLKWWMDLNNDDMTITGGLSSSRFFQLCGFGIPKL